MPVTVDDVIRAVVKGDNGATVKLNYETRSITVQTKNLQKIGLIIFSSPAFSGFFSQIIIEDSKKSERKVEDPGVHIYSGVQSTSA